MATYTTYQLYLFSQLFHLELDDSIEDVPYDLLFPVIEDELNKFLTSEYNDEQQSEYDCMQDYLTAHADTISIRIADHNNI